MWMSVFSRVRLLSGRLINSFSFWLGGRLQQYSKYLSLKQCNSSAETLGIMTLCPITSTNTHTMTIRITSFNIITECWCAIVMLDVTPLSVINGLYYKTITIVIMTIVSDATIWSITYNRNWWHQLRLN
jgi:hypothetical protein